MNNFPVAMTLYIFPISLRVIIEVIFICTVIILHRYIAKMVNELTRNKEIHACST